MLCYVCTSSASYLRDDGVCARVFLWPSFWWSFSWSQLCRISENARWGCPCQICHSYDTSADPLFERLNWKRLDIQRQIELTTMVYKSVHGLAPNYLGSLFNKYDPPYHLRNSENKLAVPLPRTNFLKNSFSYNGAVIWNTLSPELRQAKSLKSFRNGCRDFFVWIDKTHTASM